MDAALLSVICELVAMLKMRPETASAGVDGKKVCVHNFLNEGKIAAPLSVFPDGRSFTRQLSAARVCAPFVWQ